MSISTTTTTTAILAISRIILFIVFRKRKFDRAWGEGVRQADHSICPTHLEENIVDLESFSTAIIRQGKTFPDFIAGPADLSLHASQVFENWLVYRPDSAQGLDIGKITPNGRSLPVSRIWGHPEVTVVDVADDSERGRSMLEGWPPFAC